MANGNIGNVIPLRRGAGFGVVGDGGPEDPTARVVTLTMGSRGPLVRGLQLSLATWGFAPGAADGIYGANTVEAVRALQGKLGLPTDGVFGPQTAAAVKVDLSKGRSGSTLQRRIAMFAPLEPAPVPTEPVGPIVTPVGPELKIPAALAVRPAAPAEQPPVQMPPALEAPTAAAAAGGFFKNPVVWFVLAAAGLYFLWARAKAPAPPAPEPLRRRLEDLDDGDEEAIEAEYEVLPEPSPPAAVPPQPAARPAKPAALAGGKRRRRRKMPEAVKKMLAERKRRKRAAGTKDYLDT